MVWWLKGYYREQLVAASTFSDREGDAMQHDSVFGELAIAAIVFICVAVVAIAGILAFMAWQIRRRKNKIRQQS